MKRIAHTLALLALAAYAGAAAALSDPAAEFQSALYAPAPAHASLYSFSDVFRLTVAGAPLAEYPLAALQSGPALPDLPMRVVASGPQAAGYVFSIVAAAEPERWLLLLSGFAFASWVARRRLVHAF